MDATSLKEQAAKGSKTEEMIQCLGLGHKGINSASRIFYNPSYEQLFDHETSSELQGFERGTLTKSGAVAVDTGRFTGRSPKDKYIVSEPDSKDNIWWGWIRI